MSNDIRINLLLNGKDETLKKIESNINSLEKSFFKLSSVSVEQMSASISKIKDQQEKQVQQSLANLKKQQDQEERMKQGALSRQKKYEENQLISLAKKYQDFNADKIKSLQSAMSRELAIAGDNEKLKLAIKESYSLKISEIEKRNAERLKNSQEVSNSSIFDKKLSDVTIGTGALALGLGKVASVAASTFKESVNEAANFEKALIGVNSVARNLGEDAGRVQAAILDLTKDGLVQAGDAATTLKNLMASGLSLDQSISLFKSLKDAAAFNRQGMLSMGEAIAGAAQGIKNQNSIMVDNAGITKNLSIMWKDYASSLGKTVGELSDAEKAQAAFFGITKEAAIFQGDAAKLTNTYAGSIDGLEAAYKKLQISSGQLITQNGLLQRNIQTLANTLDNLSRPQDSSRKGRITSLREEIEQLQKSGSSAYGTINDLQNILNRLEKEEKAAQDSSRSLIGNSSVDELLQNGANRQRLAILTKKINDENDKIEQEKNLKLKKQAEELYNSLLKKYQDFSIDKVKEFENAESRELSIAGNNERLKQAIKEHYGQKIYEYQKSQSDKLISLQQAQFEYEEKLNKEREKKERDRVRQFENNQKTLEEFYSNPFSSSPRQRDQSEHDYGINKTLGQISGVAGASLQGKAGAQQLVSQGLSTGIGALAGSPALGQALGPIFQQLALQGPQAEEKYRAATSNKSAAQSILSELELQMKQLEDGGINTKAEKKLQEELAEKIKAASESLRLAEQELANLPIPIRDTIKEFAQSIPGIVQGIAESAPILIEELANQTPIIIEKLAEKAPDIIEALVKASPKLITSLSAQSPKIAMSIIKELPNIAVEFVSSLVKEAPKFVTELIKSISGAFGGDLLSKITGGGGGGSGLLSGVLGGIAGGPLGAVGGFVSDFFANGGIMTSKGSIPLNAYSNGGIATRPQLALFGEGRTPEAFVPLPDGNSIPVTMKNASSLNTTDDSVIYLLNKIIELLSSPQIVSSNLTLNKRVFGEIILELNRTNQRLA